MQHRFCTQTSVHIFRSLSGVLSIMSLPETVTLTPEISIIVPVYNEAENLATLAARLVPVLESCTPSFEILCIDDGSSDATLETIRTLNMQDGRIQALSFSRNFGKEIAIAAGIDHAKGQAAIIIDADLQHPPEMIPEFIRLWRQGYKNVYGQRTDRREDSPLKRMLTEKFYDLFAKFGETGLPPGAGDFRLLDRQALNALRRMREHARFSKGLYAWVGFKSIGVPFLVAPRLQGVSKFSYRKLTRFALDGIMSFSSLPLKIWTYIGILIAFVAFMTAVYFIIEASVMGTSMPGFPSLIVSIMFFAGVQLMSLGILGEYIGRIFSEVKGRPLYLIAETIGPETAHEPE